MTIPSNSYSLFLVSPLTYILERTEDSLSSAVNDFVAKVTECLATSYALHNAVMYLIKLCKALEDVPVQASHSWMYGVKCLCSMTSVFAPVSGEIWTKKVGSYGWPNVGKALVTGGAIPSLLSRIGSNGMDYFGEDQRRAQESSTGKMRENAGNGVENRLMKPGETAHIILNGKSKGRFKFSSKGDESFMISGIRKPWDEGKDLDSLSCAWNESGIDVERFARDTLSLPKGVGKLKVLKRWKGEWMVGFQTPRQMKAELSPNRDQHREDFLWKLENGRKTS